MKKAASIISFAGVLVLASSCHSYMTLTDPVDFNSYKEHKHVNVLSAETQSNIVFFSEKIPAKMTANSVTGTPQYKLHTFRADSFQYGTKAGQNIRYAFKDGRKYLMEYKGDERYIYDSSLVVQIPYSEISSLNIKVYKPGKTVLLIGGLSGGLMTIFISILPMLFINAAT